MMSGEKVAAGHRVLVPPLPVVARESTRRVVLGDAVVTRALEFIRQAAARGPVTVETVARAAGVSRENLRQRFHAALDRSPKAQIDEARLQAVAATIRHSPDSLESIAATHGFAGPEDVCRFVKRMTGKTPGSLRKESS
jgi:LacI family transcriptional regulator